MPIDTKTERRIVAREIGRNLGVAVEHLKVGARLVGTATLVVVGAAGLLAGFFGCYFGVARPLRLEVIDAVELAKETELGARKSVFESEKRVRAAEQNAALNEEWKNAAARGEVLAREAVGRLRAEADLVKPLRGIGSVGCLWSVLSAHIPAGESIEDLRALEKTILASDGTGLFEALNRDKVALFCRGTRVREIDSDGFVVQDVRVRILSGPLTGRSFWVSRDMTAIDP